MHSHLSLGTVVNQIAVLIMWREIYFPALSAYGNKRRMKPIKVCMCEFELAVGDDLGGGVALEERERDERHDREKDQPPHQLATHRGCLGFGRIFGGRRVLAWCIRHTRSSRQKGVFVSEETLRLKDPRSRNRKKGSWIPTSGCVYETKFMHLCYAHMNS